MTGYTHEMIQKDMDFPRFAMLCARAFGALILMRDDPMDAAVPETIEPEPYHRTKIEEAKAKVSRLAAMSNDERIAFGEAKKRKGLEYCRASIAANNVTNAKLTAMLEKARAWEPPTPDHVRMKEFMVQQLTDSMERNTYHFERMDDLEAKAPVQLYAEAVKRAEESVAYHEKEWAEEVERAANRTAWVRALRASLQEKAAT